MEAYCFMCRSKQEMQNPQHITLDNGRPVIQGICPVCGRKMFRTGKSKLSSEGGQSMAVKQLSELKKGDRAKIIKVSGKGSLHRRLLDMGLVSGSEIEIGRVTPLGDPIEIKAKGGNLSLRQEEAAGIQVEIA